MIISTILCIDFSRNAMPYAYHDILYILDVCLLSSPVLFVSPLLARGFKTFEGLSFTVLTMSNGDDKCLCRTVPYPSHSHACEVVERCATGQSIHHLHMGSREL